MFNYLITILLICLGANAAIEYGNFTVKGNTTLENTTSLRNEKAFRFYELGTNGSNYVALKAPSSFGVDITFTLPVLDGTNGQVLATNGSGVLSFISAGGVLTTNTQTSNYTALTSDDVIQGDTTSGAFTITLYPVSGNSGKIIRIKNIGTANSLTIDANASEQIDSSLTKILRANESITLFCNGTKWQVIAFTGRDIVTATSSVKTPTFGDRYHLLTNNSFTLTQGRWELKAIGNFFNSGSCFFNTTTLGFYSANGADTNVRPAAFSSVSGITILSATPVDFILSDTGGSGYNTSTITADAFIDVTAATSGSIFAVTYATMGTPSNCRVEVYLNARKIGD